MMTTEKDGYGKRMKEKEQAHQPALYDARIASVEGDEGALSKIAQKNAVVLG
jgi:hypothetical protein